MIISLIEILLLLLSFGLNTGKSEKYKEVDASMLQERTASFAEVKAPHS